MLIQFGEYKPDMPAQMNDGLTVATNAIPFASHYISARGLSAVSSNALSTGCKGFIYVRDGAGNAYSYAGDTSNLYQLSGIELTGASRTSGGVYSTPDEGNWEFIQFGEHVIGTNYADNVQELTIGAANFSSLSACTVKARHVAVVRDFVVLGNCTDYSSGAAVPYRVHWSGFNNVHTWTPSASTQADFQDLAGDGGWIQKIVGGEYGTIFQENAIWRMTYVGSPLVFQFDLVEERRGTPCPNSVVKAGGLIFYLGQDDFYAFNGSYSKPIGSGRIYKTFIADFDWAYWYKIFGIVDPGNTLVFWAYPGAGSSGGNPNRIIVYNWAADRWAGPLEIGTIDNLVTYQSDGYTLEQLDSVNANMDLLPSSLDSKIWMGGALNFGAFDGNHYLCTFTGSDLTAVFETGEKQLTENKRTLITNTEPLVSGSSASASVAVGGRNRIVDNYVYDADVPINSDGEAPQMNESKYHRFRVSVAGGFNKAYGLRVDASIGGQY